MRILIFSESPEAIALRDSLREDGNLAFVRTHDPFKAEELEPCEKAYVWPESTDIADAYKAAGVEVETVGETATEEKPEPTRRRRKVDA